MANTYTQLYFHVVFAVRGRSNLISKDWQQELYKYITGIVSTQEQKLMFINGMPDHIHLLIGTKPNCNLSDLVRDIKSHSTKWINKKKFVKDKFLWQNGFGAFTISQSKIHAIINYIEHQEEYHLKNTFKEEYVDFLKEHSIVYKDEYIFE